jgi:hypothetical protein
VSVIKLVDRVQRRGRSAAGDDMAAVCFGRAPIRRIPAGERRPAGLGGCARDWGRWLGQSGGAKTFGGVGIDDRRRRRLRVFDEEFVGLERFFAREKKGEKRGGRGLL